MLEELAYGKTTAYKDVRLRNVAPEDGRSIRTKFPAALAAELRILFYGEQKGYKKEFTLGPREISKNLVP